MDPDRAGLLLASEVKLLVVRKCRELDPIALDQFLTYEYVRAGTMLKGVHKVPPAHFLRYRGGQATVHRYWDAADVALKDWRDDDAGEALKSPLQTRQAPVDGGRAARRVPVGRH